MKSLRFESISMLSPKGKQARTFQFHPQKNLIVGMNHTGKSSLIKTIFKTLGASPGGKLEKWDETTISLLGVNIDNKTYFILHQLGNYALFDKEKNLIFATNEFTDWTRNFGELLDFNLIVTDKRTSHMIQADPACFFLPFYINQDGSWQSDWNTFSSVKRFKSPQTAILEYFSGVKPPKWYEIEARRRNAQKELDELIREQSFLERARDRFNKSMTLSGPKLCAENFETEILQLSKEVTILNCKQEKLRDQAVKEKQLIASVQMQNVLVHEALKAYESDSQYLMENRERLICPTCNAEHLEPFIELFEFAEEARTLRILAMRLADDLKQAKEKYIKTNNELQGLQSNYKTISEILSTRRGELEFKQIIDSVGAEQAFTVFEKERRYLQEIIKKESAIIHDMSIELKDLTNRNRSNEILNAFRQTFSAALQSLNLPIRGVQKMKLTSRPDLSGSGGPRLILAYYAALWSVCLGKYGSFSVPLVIDSPNQQGQDKVNLPKVLEFIANLPNDDQIIVGSEIPTDSKFDSIITLDSPYSLLNKSEFNEISGIIDPLVKAMYNKVKIQKDLFD